MSTKCPTCGHEYAPQAAPGLKGACPRCVAELLRSRPGDASHSGPVHEDDAPPLAAGARLGKFEVLEYIGRGGMGFVYKAKQAGLDRVVALKVLAPRLAGSPEFAARFGREAKALAALSHPNIVQIHDYGQENGLYFLVMEYVDGTSLRRILSTQRISPETALRYVPQICDALEYAHTAGVVHRDIKPENILIDKRGGLKIADFGLAKIAVSPPSLEPGTTNQEPGTRNVRSPEDHATVSGQVMGTPHYMAPEQVENMAAVDHRADIYSLGVVFYEMLTGELPLGRFPSPSQRVQVDVRFDEVVLKALEKEPEKRYQRASLVKDDITMIATSGARRDLPAPASPGKTVITIRARAQGPGRIVNWIKFKQGELRDSGWNFGLTTMLTDVVTDIIAECRRINPACTVTPLFPNGFTTASFDIAIKGIGFQVSCGRRLVRGLFPLNPIAASFGRNYDVLVTISADEPGLGEQLADVVRRKYHCELAPETLVEGSVGSVSQGGPSLSTGQPSPAWLKALSIVVLAGGVIGVLGLCMALVYGALRLLGTAEMAETSSQPPTGLGGNNGEITTGPVEIEIVEPARAEHKVSTAAALIDAIGSGRHIRLESGDYVLSDVPDSLKEHVTWNPVHDGETIVFDGLKRLTISGPEDRSARLLVKPQYAFVLEFRNCEDIRLENLVLGHAPETGTCERGVLGMVGVRGAAVVNCDLFGCGTEGLTLTGVSDFAFSKSRVRDCTYGIMTIKDCRRAVFSDSEFTGNQEFWGVQIQGCGAVAFRSCSFAKNAVDGPLFAVNSSEPVTLENTSTADNEVTALTDDPKNLRILSGTPAAQDASGGAASPPAPAR